MKITCIKILFFFFIIENSVMAQLSDSLYAVLPSSIRPVNKSALTAKEKQVLLTSAEDQISTIYYKELTRLAESLAADTKETNDRETKIYNSIAIAAYYFAVSDAPNARTYFRQALQYIGDQKDHEDLCSKIYRHLGAMDIYDNKLDSGMHFLFHAFDIAKARNDSTEIKFAYEQLSNIYYALQLYKKSIENNQQFLKYLGSHEKWSTDYTRGFLDNAICYAKLFAQTRDSSYIDSAIKVVSEVKARKKIDSLSWYSSCYTFLGYVYFFKRDYPAALIYFDSSLIKKYKDKDNDMYYHLPFRKYFYKALCLFKTGRYAAGKSLMDSITISQFSDKMMLNEALYEYAASVGDWKAAYNYHKDYVRYSDSMQIIGQDGIAFSTQEKYEIAEKNTQIAELKNQNLRKEKRQNTSISIAVSTAMLLLIAIAVIYRLYRRSELVPVNERQQLTGDLYKMLADLNDERAVSQIQQQSVIKEERKRISENIHDEIMSGMAAFRYRIAYGKSKAKDSKLKNMLNGMEEDALVLYLQTKDFLSKMNKKALPSVNNYDVIKLMENLSTRFNDEAVLKVEYQCDGMEVRKYFTEKNHYELYLVIKEAVVNVIKHTNANKISIHLFFSGPLCLLAISDNGKGFDTNKVNALPGLQNKVKALDGTLVLNPDKKGTVLQISFAVSSQKI
jgi:signal transduction histidine kinase